MHEAYFPETGQAVYEQRRKSSGKQLKLLQVSDFIEYAVRQIIDHKWSPDAVVGHVKKQGLFKKRVVCAKTLYNYIDQGLIAVKNIDLTLKVAINTKKNHVCKNKKVLGKSISERPPEIELRDEFGHWEIDTVIGKKSGDEALLTITKRKTRTT